MAEASGSNLESAEGPAKRPRYRYGGGAVSVPRDASAVGVSAVLSPVSVAGPSYPILQSNDLAWLIAGGVVFLGAFYLLFRINCFFLVITWARDSSWSHGFAVPVLSAVLISMQWDRLRRMKVKGSWVGFAILLYGVASQVLFMVTGQLHLSHMSMVVVLLGAALMVFGWDYMRVLWLPICFLLFMINLPTTIYVKITTPLQNIAATAGTILLPLFGIESIRQGTTLQILNHGPLEPLNVAEACSGIRSLMAFVALAVILAYTTARPIWQKLFLAACAIPVAIFCNALRVTLTGVLTVYAPAYSKGSAHEMLGFLMLIPAGLIQLGIAWTLDRMFIDDGERTLSSMATVRQNAGGRG